ncbi:MAG: methyltransferase [Nocardioides sp.]
MTTEHITTRQEVINFGGLDIMFDDRVLRPRPWTTAQSRWAAELLRDAPEGPVLELCSGAGQIGLLAVAYQPRDLVCVDIDPVACGFARHNAHAARLSARVEVREGAMSEVVSGTEQYAVVVADPPWVPSREVSRFPEDPLRAIDGGPDGTDLVLSCLAVIERCLMVGGSAVVQVGTSEQADFVGASLPAASGLTLIGQRELGGGVLVRLDRPA